jgi:group I intron endonuclease
MFIYKITNLINGKIYIGQTTTTIEKRWKRHSWSCTQKDPKMAITYAIKKYGKENFKIEQIDTANSIKELNEKEIFYIKSFNSLSPNGYNLTTGGLNKVLSEETRKKISQSNKGKIVSDETRKKSSESHKGYKVKKETKEKISIALKGRIPSEKAKLKSIEVLSKTYTLISPNGEKITFTNMAKFCKENNLSNSKLCLVVQGKRNHHKGWKRP